MLTVLDDGLWEADARLELEEVAEAVDARLTGEEEEVDTLGGLASVLAGHVPATGECVDPPVGLASCEAVRIPTRARIMRVARLARARKRDDAARAASSFANSLAGSAIALNSSALPAGSSRNIVACSPGSPAKRTVGAITNSMPARFEPRRQAPSTASIGSTRPKCGTGTSSPSTGLVGARAHRIGREMGDDLVAVEIEIDPADRRCVPRGSRAARRRSARAAARSSTGKARWNGGRRHASASCAGRAIAVAGFR